MLFMLYAVCLGVFQGTSANLMVLQEAPAQSMKFGLSVPIQTLTRKKLAVDSSGSLE